MSSTVNETLLLWGNTRLLLNLLLYPSDLSSDEGEMESVSCLYGYTNKIHTWSSGSMSSSICKAMPKKLVLQSAWTIQRRSRRIVFHKYIVLHTSFPVRVYHTKSTRQPAALLNDTRGVEYIVGSYLDFDHHLGLGGLMGIDSVFVSQNTAEWVVYE